MGKIGFLYTIGLLLMSLTVFSLALFIADVEKESNENVASLVKYDRLNDLDTSINEGFTKIFKIASGITFKYTNSTNNTIFFKENLPNTNNTIFKQNMSSFEKYLNKTINLKSDNITFYRSNLINVEDNLPLTLMPYNLTYTHRSNFGDSTIAVFRRGSINGYNISISTPVDVILGKNDLKPGADTLIEIKVKGPGTPVKAAFQRIDTSPGKQSHFLLRKSADSSNFINISINNTMLTIRNIQPATKIDVSTGIMMKSNSTSLTQIFYPRKIYNITLKDFNIKTVSDVMIYSLPV